MEHYQQSLMAGQMLDMAFLQQSVPMEGMDYRLQQTPAPLLPLVKDERFKPNYVGPSQNFQDAEVSPTYSDSSKTSQSLSPHLHEPHLAIAAMQMPNMHFSNDLGRISPTATDTSRRGSEDDSQRAERRRAQNRAAQRAYRQRKDLGLKQREVEIEALREELNKTRRLNQTLCKVVSVLRQRLKEKGPENQGLVCDDL